jgi:CheY-like chemotaxis protein
VLASGGTIRVTSEDLRPEPAPAHGPVILLVEDEVLIRLVAAEFLREEGYTVLEAADAVEALVLFSSGHSLDLVITDVRMPGELDGLKLSYIMKEAKPDLPVALASGHFGADEDHPADRFLRKPYTPQELLGVVNELIDQEWQNGQTSAAF